MCLYRARLPRRVLLLGEFIDWQASAKQKSDANNDGKSKHKLNLWVNMTGIQA
jgi:hypothetical protein